MSPKSAFCCCDLNNISVGFFCIKVLILDPGWDVQLIRMLTQYTQGWGFDPQSGTYKNQVMNA